MPSVSIEKAESCYTLQPGGADESLDMNSFVKATIYEVVENLKIEVAWRHSKPPALKPIITNTEFMKSEDNVPARPQYYNDQGENQNRDLSNFLEKSLNVNVNVFETNRRNPSVKGDRTGCWTKKSTEYKGTSPWVNLIDPIEKGHRQPLPETLDDSYNGMGPFKPSIWTFDIMSRLEFLLTSAASPPKGITFLGNCRT